MKKYVIAIWFVIIAGGLAFSAVTTPNLSPPLPKDSNETPVQAPAFNYQKDVTLTGNSQNVEVTKDFYWQTFGSSSATGVFRIMSSATKLGTAHTISAGYGELVNHKVTSKTFLNISGMTGTLRRQ